MNTSQRVAWIATGLLWAAYLVLDGAAGASGPGHTLLKGLLMPALLLAVLASMGSRSPRLLVAGLVMATIGDVGLEHDATFLVGMAGFLAMQLCYIAGFLGLGAGRTLTSRRPSRWPVAAGYLALWVVANLILGPQLGELRLPVAVYSAALCTMAATAAGVDRRVGVGGLAFLLSDLTLAANMADWDFPGRGTFVMVTYLGGQYLIATGWMRRMEPKVPVPL